MYVCVCIYICICIYIYIYIYIYTHTHIRSWLKILLSLHQYDCRYRTAKLYGIITELHRKMWNGVGLNLCICQVERSFLLLGQAEFSTQQFPLNSAATISFQFRCTNMLSVQMQKHFLSSFATISSQFKCNNIF